MCVVEGQLYEKYVVKRMWESARLCNYCGCLLLMGYTLDEGDSGLNWG